MNILEIKKMSFCYKKYTVLQDISCSFEKGKIYSILGHNGAGKTTFIRLCLGLLTPKSGSIEYVGNPVLSYMPDRGGLFELLTVEQNLTTFLNLNEVPKAEQQQFIEDNLHKWKLHSKKKNLVNQLSSGQRQRLSLIIAEINHPDIYFLDEPTNGIDINSQELLNQHLLKLKEKGSTIIISSHNINMIEEVSDEVVIINEHEIAYRGCIADLNDLKEVYKKYAIDEEEEE